MDIVNRVIRFLLPRLGDMLLAGAFVAVIGFGPRLLNIDGDLGRHLTIGSYILDSGKIPTRDIFSHTMVGEPLTPHEWASQVVFSLAYRLMGLDGVVVLCAVLVSAAFFLAYRDALRRSGLPLVSLGLTLLALAASTLHWLARPHLFTLLMVPIWVLMLEKLREGRRWPVMVLPLVMAIWANLHGAFIAGFVIWLAYAAGAVWEWIVSPTPLPQSYIRRLLLTGLLSLLATFLNPVGPELWGTSLGYLGNSYLVNHTAEYFSPDFHQVSTWPFLMILVLMLTLTGLLKARIPAHGALLMGGWALMALVSARNIPLFAVLAAPILSQAVLSWQKNGGEPAILRREERLFKMERMLAGYAWPVLIAFLVTFSLNRGAVLDLAQKGNNFDDRVFPVKAVNWLEKNPQEGELFNYFPWGGYLLYRFWPAGNVFIDGQTDFYGETLTRKYEQILNADSGWEGTAREYAIQYTLLPPDTTISLVLAQQPGWKMVYQDGTAVIFRSSP